ncbi:hypothetical protein GPJ56_006500 [Histomonas meleagridis]|uniref:uncharacterized protein n=1 Tax=Histomonas meleagridis TaxID=135588 RepID=UPI00355A586A|nr:hypothetical protein GPJ56_006500 [Histomonas meleagridis]KAH0801737.1 hypothetical protein GO595_005418 [Histomonas meleagridis]
MAKNHIISFSNKMDFDKMWADTIYDDDNPGTTLGGNLTSLTNFCCVRLSHALMSGGHTITQTSDFKDKNGKRYIIRCATMKAYLTQKISAPKKILAITKTTRGIVYFEDCGFSDATGHFALVKKGVFRRAGDNYSNLAKSIYLWEFKDPEEENNNNKKAT